MVFVDVTHEFTKFKELKKNKTKKNDSCCPTILYLWNYEVNFWENLPRSISHNAISTHKIQINFFSISVDVHTHTWAHTIHELKKKTSSTKNKIEELDYTLTNY